METIKALAIRYWKLWAGVLLVGFVLGVAIFAYAQQLAIEGMQKKLDDQKRESLSSSIFDCNIGGKGIDSLILYVEVNGHDEKGSYS